jgi:hypothetical protein
MVFCHHRWSTLSLEANLVLKSDGSFEYSYSGGECGTFDHGGTGKWKKDGNELTLEVSDDLFLLSKRYTIDKRRLVPSDDPSRDGAFRMTGGDARPLGQ